MKHTGIVIGTWFALGIAAPGMVAPSWALMRPEISLGARVGMALFEDDEIGGTDAELDQAPVLGVTLGIRQRQFGGELSIDWIESDLDASSGRIGALRTIPVLLTGRFHFLPEDSGFDPYLGLGVGYYLNDFDAAGAGDLDIDNTVGVHLNAGANLRVTTALGVALEARYVAAEADAETPGVTDELDLGGFVVTAGVRYSFPR